MKKCRGLTKICALDAEFVLKTAPLVQLQWMKMMPLLIWNLVFDAESAIGYALKTLQDMIARKFPFKLRRIWNG